MFQGMNTRLKMCQMYKGLKVTRKHILMEPWFHFGRYVARTNVDEIQDYNTHTRKEGKYA